MDRELDVLTMLLLDPCLTADEAAREAAARHHLATAATAPRDERTKPRPPRRPAPRDDRAAVGF